jgi:hypothetical protein
VVDYARQIRRRTETIPAGCPLPPKTPIWTMLHGSASGSCIPADARYGARGAPFTATRAIAEAAVARRPWPRIPATCMVLAGFMRTLTPYFIDRVNTVFRSTVRAS